MHIINRFLSLHKRYLSNLGATFVSQAVSALSVLILTPYFLKELGTAQFSIYGVILNLIVFSSIFDFGLNIGLLRKLVHRDQDQIQLINILFVFFIGLFIFSIPIYIGVFNLGFVSNTSHSLFIPILVAIVVSQNIIAILFDVIIQSVNKIFIGKLIRIIRTLIEFVLLFFICKTGSVKFLLLTTVCVNFVYILTLFLFSKKELNYHVSINYFNWTVLKEHIVYSFWYFQNAVASVMVYNAQIIMISNFVDSINVARYLVVTRFYDVIRTGLTNFTMVLFPTISSLQAEGNWKKIKKVYLSVLFRIAILVLITFSIILTFGQNIFLQWSRFNDSIVISLFQIYSVFVALLIIEHVPTVFLAAFKFNKYPSIVASIQGLLGLLFTYLLIPYYGIIGGVAGSLIAFLLTNFWFNLYYLNNKINQQINIVNES
jgi:O-antigen/teichoic acid export membrane protein